MKYLLLAMLVSGSARANEFEHFAVAGGIQTTAYLGLRKALHVESKPFALISATIVSGGMAAMAEYSKPRFNNRTFEAAGLGILTSSVLLLTFDL